jgi:hypothetical protein
LGVPDRAHLYVDRQGRGFCQRPMNPPQKWPLKIPHLAVVGDQPGG